MNLPSTAHPEVTVEKLLTIIQRLSAEIRPGQTPRIVDLDSSLERELGFDSLGRMELLARLEQSFDTSLPESLLASAETPRDLLRAIAGSNVQRIDLSTTDIPTGISGGGTVTSPYKARTLVEMLEWHVEKHPERQHLQFYTDTGDGEILTYRELFEQAARVATSLQRLGIQPGQTVALMLPTEMNYFFSFYGVILAGAIPVPLYPPVRPAQIEDHLRRQAGILKNCLACALITVPRAKAVAHLLKSQVATLNRILTPDALLNSDLNLERPALTNKDTAFLQYTSGSTGTPKGVVLTHANLLSNIRVDGEALHATPEDVFVSWLPLYHDMGLIGAWLGSLYFGVPLVIMSPLTFLSRPERWLWAIHRHHGTLSAAPNFAFELCLNRIDEKNLKGLDLSSWRVALNGAEAIIPDTLERFCDKFSQYGFQRQTMFPVYGLAECTVGLTFPPLGREPVIDSVQRDTFMSEGIATIESVDEESALRFVACGQPLPGHEIRIVDDTSRELPERQVGRIQFRGVSATSGYFHNPEQTRRLFDKDWLETGDLGYIAAGDLYISGRSKDIIIRAGRNIYPEELEAAISEIEGIRKGRIAVFGSKNTASGSEKLIVLAETHEINPEIRHQLCEKINTLAVDLIMRPPDEVVLAPPGTVLKTSSGKIRRAASRNIYEKGEVGKQSKAAWLQLASLALRGAVPQIHRIWQASRVILYAGSTWFLFLLLVITGIAALLVLPLKTWRIASMRKLNRFFALASGTSFKVEGLEHLPKPHRPCVVVANHASYLDGYALIAALPFDMCFVAKKELQKNSVLRILMQRIGIVFIERFEHKQTIADASHLQEVLHDGSSLMMFPEGTFKRMPGLLPFHLGAFAVAAAAEVPVIPVAIRGTRSILRANSWFPRKGSIVVTIGPMIEPENNEGDQWKTAVQLRDQTRKYLLRHCGEPDLSHGNNQL